MGTREWAQERPERERDQHVREGGTGRHGRERLVQESKGGKRE